MQVCGVCAEQVPKYRCPTCRVRYCSLLCYKKHKDGCVPELPAPPSAPLSWTQNSGDWAVEDFLDEDSESDRVPLQRLKQLGESEELKALLRNPHLRRLLLTVDRAESKADIMKTAMQEPLFVEFADQCLKIVEPLENEDTMD
ncbi:zinc finger HIT domain-containing protein 3 isoform X1 [Scleropages formosus]|uniref:Zinc finger HIT domain-containing protein 3 n=1 Tax=Scleropages formosus TaxID=113540 RepID=A0A8C9TI47_SCLFO|nr:zinc finger HIT domain-containing protein 3 isoform X1 [Scleropages formosus]